MDSPAASVSPTASGGADDNGNELVAMEFEGQPPARRVPLYSQKKSILSNAGHERRRAYKKSSAVHFPKESVATIILESSEEDLAWRSKIIDDQILESDSEDFGHGQFIRQDSIILKVRPGDKFSEHAELCVEPPAGDVAFGTLSELRYKLNTGKKTQVKKFLRSNDWPSTHRIRSELWRELCNDRDHTGRTAVFRETLARLQSAGLLECQLRPPACSVSSGAIVTDYKLTTDGRKALRRVLAVVEHVRPDFTCIPILYPLAAALLHYMDEESAYCCVLQLLERRAAFLLQTDIAVTASRRTIWKLAKKYKMDSFKYLRKVTRHSDDSELIDVFAEWKAWLFSDLPFEHTVRVIDCFLFEGQKVLFRSALAALHSWHRRRKSDGSLKSRGKLSIEEVSEDIRLHCRTITVTPDKFMKLAFSIRNLKMSSIHKAQQASELERRLNDDLERGQKVSSYNLAKASMSLNAGLVELLGELRGVDAAMALTVQSWLPAPVTLLEPVLLFSLDEHGTSFTQLWQRVQRYEPTLWIWRTSNGYLFGAYCSVAWSERIQRHRQKTTYFGNGQCFLFRLISPVNATAKPIRYTWVGSDNVVKTTHGQELFQAAGNDWMKIGGGAGDGISVADDLTRVATAHCQTFENPPLAGEGAIFETEQLFVYGFTETGELEPEE